MRNNTLLTICILLASAMIIIGCKGETGPTGPTGPQGTSGTSYKNLWESFESGTFTTYPWQLTGNANWQIASDRYMFGFKSACSGTITHSQSTKLTIQVNLPTASLVSFYWDISCELYNDYLYWSIDEYMIDGRSGISYGFYPATFGVSPGAHTISWTYRKNASISSGADKAWIDGILITDYALAKQSAALENPIPSGVVSLKQKE